MKKNRKTIILTVTIILGLFVLLGGFIFFKNMGLIGNNPEGENLIISINMQNGDVKEIHRRH